MISLNLVLSVLVTVFLLAINEVLKRKFSLPAYFTRKVAHIGGSIVAFFASGFLNQAEIVFIGIFLGIFFLLVRRTKILSSIYGVSRLTAGDILLPVGIVFSAIIFLPKNLSAFQYGILVLGVSDGLAGLIGETFSKKHIKVWGSQKTLLGFFVFFLSTLILTAIFLPGFGYEVLLISFLLTLVELGLGYGSDNLVLPALASYLITFFI